MYCYLSQIDEWDIRTLPMICHSWREGAAVRCTTFLTWNNGKRKPRYHHAMSHYMDKVQEALPSGNNATTPPFSKQANVCSKSLALLRVLVSTGKTPAALRILPAKGILKNRLSAQKWHGRSWGKVAIRTAGSSTMFMWLAATSNGPSLLIGARVITLTLRKYPHTAKRARNWRIWYVVETSSALDLFFAVRGMSTRKAQVSIKMEAGRTGGIRLSVCRNRRRNAVDQFTLQMN